jgi:hypothetical protein
VFCLRYLLNFLKLFQLQRVNFNTKVVNKKFNKRCPRTEKGENELF